MNTLLAIYAGLEPYAKTIVSIVAVLAPTGALWRWRSIYKSRMHAKVRDFGPAALQHNFVQFKIENLGTATTSLNHLFTMCGYSPEKLKFRYTFTIQGNERTLQPHIEKSFMAAHDTPKQRNILFLWYTEWKITLTQGQTITLRFRNADFKPIGFLRFRWELMLFRIFDQISVKNAQSAIAQKASDEDTLHLVSPTIPVKSSTTTIVQRSFNARSRMAPETKRRGSPTSKHLTDMTAIFQSLGRTRSMSSGALNTAAISL